MTDVGDGDMLFGHVRTVESLHGKSTGSTAMRCGSLVDLGWLEAWWPSPGAVAAWCGAQAHDQEYDVAKLTLASSMGNGRDKDGRHDARGRREAASGQSADMVGVRSTMAWRRACMRWSDTWPWIAVGHSHVGPTISIFLKTGTNFEIQNEGLPDVQNSSNFAWL
jgi:hypothetical protein